MEFTIACQPSVRDYWSPSEAPFGDDERSLAPLLTIGATLVLGGYDGVMSIVSGPDAPPPGTGFVTVMFSLPGG